MWRFTFNCHTDYKPNLHIRHHRHTHAILSGLCAVQNNDDLTTPISTTKSAPRQLGYSAINRGVFLWSERSISPACVVGLRFSSKQNKRGHFHLVNHLGGGIPLVALMWQNSRPPYNSHVRDGGQRSLNSRCRCGALPFIMWHAEVPRNNYPVGGISETH